MGFRAPKGSQDYEQKWFVSLCQKPLWACAKSCLTLCDPMDCRLPGSSVQGFPRQESWSGLPCPPPGGSSWPRDQTPISYVSCIAGRFFTTSAPWEAHYGHSLCLIVCVCVCVCDHKNQRVIAPDNPWGTWTVTPCFLWWHTYTQN